MTLHGTAAIILAEVIVAVVIILSVAGIAGGLR